ncbi:16382_t:CDS:2, partial [Gigaspora margarita]
KKKKSKTKVHGDYLPTGKKIDEIIESYIPENTCKATQNIETVTNKDQLEKEMMEFFCSMRKIQDESNYSPSSLVNTYNCLSNYIYKHPGGSQKFVINNKSEFPLLWEALNRKIKVLKQFGKVTKHHDPLSPDELRTIFNHKALLINTAKGLQYRSISIVTSMSITGYKSESSYCKYLKPSKQQKKDALSMLINVVDLPESQDNDAIEDFVNKNQDLIKLLFIL